MMVTWSSVDGACLLSLRQLITQLTTRRHDNSDSLPPPPVIVLSMYDEIHYLHNIYTTPHNVYTLSIIS